MQKHAKPRVAIIGCGGMGRAHAQALLAFGGLELVAAADPFAEPRAAMKKAANSIQLYENANDMLERERPNLVVVATAAAHHRDLVIAALHGGAHVLCEKPFSVTLAEADEMLAVAQETGRMLLVDHQFRINPRVQACLRLVREGALGDVLSMEMIHGAFESHFQGGNRMTLPLERRDHPLERRLPRQIKETVTT